MLHGKIESVIENHLNTFVANDDYHIKRAFALSNEREVVTKGKITYIMFFQNGAK